MIKRSRLNLDPNSLMKDPRGDAAPCKTFVVAVPTKTGAVPIRLRTYDTQDDPAVPACIWEAARATSAALTFFAPITIDDTEYCDGGFGWNNPVEEAIAEAHYIWPKRPIGCLLSIGTGLEDAIQLDAKGKKSLKKKLLEKSLPKISFRKAVAEYCVESLISCERIHRKVLDDLHGHDVEGRYFRFNVDQGMSKIGMEEWERIGDMITFTKTYMARGDHREPRKRIVGFLLDPKLAS